MAEANKDLLTRLADRGEQVVGRITDLPGAKMILDSTTSLTKRLDDVQKRLRSLDPLEKRVTTLEKRLDKIEGKGATKRPAAKRTTTKTAPKTTTRTSAQSRRDTIARSASKKRERPDDGRPKPRHPWQECGEAPDL